MDGFQVEVREQVLVKHLPKGPELYPGGELTDEMRAAVDALVPARIAVTVHADRVVSWDHRKLPRVRPDEIGS